jgi:hypothetical protein
MCAGCVHVGRAFYGWRGAFALVGVYRGTKKNVCSASIGSLSFLLDKPFEPSLPLKNIRKPFRMINLAVSPQFF